LSTAQPDHGGLKGNRRSWRSIAIALAVTLLIIALGARVYLPIWATAYVNKTLASISGYSGSVSDIDIALFRGAYIIRDLKLEKKVRDIPVPFMAVQSIDLSLQWGALFKGALVGDVTLNRPILNFAKGQSGSTSQTGEETDWTRPIKALMPLAINWIEVNNGRVSFQDFSSTPRVDLFVDDLHLKATNVRNVEDADNPLPSEITMSGNSIGHGKIFLDGRINFLRKLPDMALKAKLESVHLPTLNDYTRSFAAVDFTAGSLSVYSDLTVNDGGVNGFIKPLATDIELIDVERQDANPLNLLWESTVSGLVRLFKNHPKDQVATQIPLEGHIENPEIGFWSTLFGILHNAFVKAYSRTVEQE